MSPTEARAMIGKVLVPTVTNVSDATIRFVVKGISGDSFRLQSLAGHQSRAIIAEVDLALRRGLLQIEN